MPFKYVKPAVFLEYKGVTLYHVYKNGEFSNCRIYWYTTDIEAADEAEGSTCKFDYDVREIYKKVQSKLKFSENQLNYYVDGDWIRAQHLCNQQEVFRKAIDAGLIQVPE